MRVRRLLAVLWAMVPFLLLLVLSASVPVPERLPSHWSGARPDGFTGGASMLRVCLGVSAVATVAATLATLFTRAFPAAWLRWLLAAASAVGWAAAGTYLASLLGTRLAGADPTQVSALWALVPVLLLIVGAVVGYAVHGRAMPAREDVLSRVPERDRVAAADPGGQREPWRTEVESGALRFAQWFVLVVMLGTAVLLWLSGSGVVLTLLIAALGLALTVFVALWSAVVVVVDRDGLMIRSRRGGPRLLRVPGEQVLGVSVQDLDPLRWGGVGLRALPDRTAYIARGGPGMVVHRRDGRLLAVEVTAGEGVARAGAAALRGAAASAQAGSDTTSRGGPAT